LTVDRVISGAYTYTSADGTTQPRWGVLLDLSQPVQTAAWSGGQVTVQPMQFVTLAIAVVVVVGIIATDLAVSHLADDFLSAVKITAADTGGPWDKVAGAAQTGAWAGVIFALGLLVLAVGGRRRWQAT